MFNNDPQTDSEDDTRSDEEKAKALGQQTSASEDEDLEARKKAFKSIRNAFGNK